MENVKVSPKNTIQNSIITPKKVLIYTWIATGNTGKARLKSSLRIELLEKSTDQQ